MNKQLLAGFLWLISFAAFAQANPTATTITHSLSLPGLQVGRPVSLSLDEANKNLYRQARKNGATVLMFLELTDVPADLARNILSSNSKPVNKISDDESNKVVVFRNSWEPGTTMTFKLRRAGSEAEPMVMELKEPDNMPNPPVASAGQPAAQPVIDPDAEPLPDDAYALDFCPSATNPIQLPKKREWAYLKPGEQTRMIINHINPLHYAVSVGAEGVAVNTDAAAVRSAVDAFLKNAVTASAASASSQEELIRLIDIPYALSAKIAELRKSKCLTSDDIRKLQEFINTKAEELRSYPNEARLDITFKTLAGIVERDTAAIVFEKAKKDEVKPVEAEPKKKPKTGGKTSAKQNNENPAKAETDSIVPVTPEVKSFRAALATYAKKEGLAKSIILLMNQLKGVAGGVRLETDVINVDDYKGVDIIRFTKNTKNLLDSLAPVREQHYDIWITGRSKFDYSAGPVLTWLADQTQTVIDEVVTQNLPVDGVNKGISVVRQRVVDEAHDKVTLALSTLGHLYWRTNCYKGGLNVGLTLGGGITTKGRPILLVGGSLLLGRQQRLVLSGGIAVGTQKERSIRYDNTTNYYASAPADAITYVDRTRVKGFFGLTFNFGNNEKITTILGTATAAKKE